MKTRPWLVVLASLLAACGQPGASEQRDLLFVQAAGGVAVIAAGDDEPAFEAPAGVPSHDWSTVVRAVPVAGGTEVIASNPLTGAKLWSRLGPGRLRVRAVSSDGSTAVLEPAGSGYQSSPRLTRFFIARRERALMQEIRLRGNFAPEAFSTDNDTLFVVQYLPAASPRRYRVRQLDLDSGKVQGVLSVGAKVQGAMRGTARIQAISPAGDRLYTLYTQGARDNAYAFVHVLDLAEKWAHCIDLPQGFASAPNQASALTLSPDGAKLYVVNAREELVAEIDTGSLAVVRTAPFDITLGKGAYATASDDALYIGTGYEVVELDTAGFAQRRSWGVAIGVSGLQLSEDARRLYVGQVQDLAVVDLERGRLGRDVSLPALGKVNRLGRVLPVVEPARQELVCGC